MTNTEGAPIAEEFRNVAIIDRVNTTMAVWMGTTINCAQCHTHKFEEPITNRRIFPLLAFFNNTDDANRGDESPLLSVYSEEQKQQRARDEKIAELRQSLERSNPELASGSSRNGSRRFPPI